MTFFNDALETVPLAPDDWLICLGVVIWADELTKVVGRWLSR
jgi:hypothetical protein